MQYFDHDTNAHKDERIILLRKNCGGAAVDAYYSMIEVMYRDGSRFDLTDAVAVESLCTYLFCEPEQLNTWVNYMTTIGLLKIEGDTVYSARCESRIGEYDELVSRRKEYGSRGGKASAKQVLSKSQASAKQVLSNIKEEVNIKKDSTDVESKESDGDDAETVEYDPKRDKLPIPCTPEQVKAYADSKQLVPGGMPETEAVKFCGYWEDNDWKRGRKPLKSAERAVVNWLDREPKAPPGIGENTPTDPWAGVT